MQNLVLPASLALKAACSTHFVRPRLVSLLELGHTAASPYSQGPALCQSAASAETSLFCWVCCINLEADHGLDSLQTLRKAVKMLLYLVH